MIFEHEPDPRLPDRCRYCGGKMKILGAGASCIERTEGTASAPRPIPPSGVDDSDAIFARLAELRKEREGIRAATAPAEVPLADSARDGDCG
jgi:hypothetical protein